MNKPIVFNNKDNGDVIEVDSLRSFIKQVYTPNTKYTIEDFNILYNRTGFLKKRTGRMIFAIGLIGFLGYKKFVKLEKKIKALEETSEMIKDDYDEYYNLKDRIDDLEAQVQDLERRLFNKEG